MRAARHASDEKQASPLHQDHKNAYFSSLIAMFLESNVCAPLATRPMRNRDHRYTPIKNPLLFLDNYLVS
jgi:hypothetical protein